MALRAVALLSIAACAAALSVHKKAETTVEREPLWKFVDLKLPKDDVRPMTPDKSSLIQTESKSSPEADGVDVFIGSAGHGHTFPGATTPWGMVQATPWIHNKIRRQYPQWDSQSGYDSTIKTADFHGMAHTALSGAGSGEMGELRIIPHNGNRQKWKGDELYQEFMMSSAVGHPGYFSGRVAQPSMIGDVEKTIFIESTASPRGAVHRFTFPTTIGHEKTVSIDLNPPPDSYWGLVLSDFNHSISNMRRFEGCTHSNNQGIGNANSLLCFVIEFDQPFLPSDETRHPSAGSAINSFAFPPQSSNVIEARVGISRFSLDGARKAFENEVQYKSFEEVLKAAEDKWDQALGVIQADIPPQRKRVFYTALYHTMIAPHLLSDEDGQYRLAKAGRGKPIGLRHVESEMVKQKNFRGKNPMYHTFSLWDTYRSLHPLMNLIHPEQSEQFAVSLMAMSEIWGFLPPWQLTQSPTDMMGGDGGTIALAGMALNLPGRVNQSRVLSALKKVRRNPVDDRALLDMQGFIPKVSEFIEQAKADHCVALLAKEVGDAKEAEFFHNRANLVFHQWDVDQQIFAPILSTAGSVLKHKTVNNKDRSQQGYQEGSPLQYSWAVDFDQAKMEELRGGTRNFTCSLDKFFSGKEQGGVPDMTGNVGMMSIGNEPTMHMPYLYALAGYPAKTQAMVDKVVKEMFTDSPAGLPGNDDLGQMSSWAVLSMLGFYPVDTCSGEYVLGRPFVNKAELSLSDTTKLEIKVNGQSDENKFVQKVELNGQPVDMKRATVTFQELSRGGILEFWMSSVPTQGAPLWCPKN